MLLFYTVANDFSSVAAYIPIDKSRGFTLLLVKKPKNVAIYKVK